MDEIPCSACGAPLQSGLPLCVRCGEPVPEHWDAPRCLVLRAGSSRIEDRRRAEQLLAHTADGLTAEELRRQLERLPAIFRLPASDAVTASLVKSLEECGYTSEVHTRVPDAMDLREYLDGLWAMKARLVPYGALAVGCLAALVAGAAWTAILLAGGAYSWWAFDRRRFRRRITLEPALLARRLDVVPEEVARPLGALLRGLLGDSLRAAVGAVLTEHASLLGAVRRLAGSYPDVAVPLREALDALAAHATRLAERAAVIERAGNFEDPRLAERMARLRARGSEEVERRLLDMDIAQELRQGRVEWLRQVRATLIVRLEAMADGMRSLRQRAVEAEVMESAAAAAAVDALIGDLRRELDVTTDAVGEMDELDQRVARAMEPA